MQKKNILFLCTPFDAQNGKLLNNMNVPLFKIASFSLTNTILLESIAKHKKPVIMSTGLHTIGEIENAYNIFKKSGNLLQYYNVLLIIRLKLNTQI